MNNTEWAQIHRDTLTRLFATAEKTSGDQFYSMLDRYVQYMLDNRLLIDLIKESRRFGAGQRDGLIKFLGNMTTMHVDAALSDLRKFCDELKKTTPRIDEAWHDIEILQAGNYHSPKHPALSYYDHICYLIIALNEAGHHKFVSRFATLDKDKGIEAFTFSKSALELERVISKKAKQKYFDPWDSWLELIRLHYLMIDDFDTYNKDWGEYRRSTELSFGIQALEQRDKQITEVERNMLMTHLSDANNFMLQQLSSVPYRTSMRIEDKDPDESQNEKHLFSPSAWEQITVEFLNQQETRIRIKGNKTRTLDYKAYGMVDRRNGRPDTIWDLFVRYSEGKGSLVWNSRDEKARLRKQKDRMAQRLKEFFHLDESPFLDSNRFTSTKKGQKDEALVSILKFKVIPAGDLDTRDIAKLDAEIKADWNTQVTKMPAIKARKDKKEDY